MGLSLKKKTVVIEQAQLCLFHTTLIEKTTDPKWLELLQEYTETENSDSRVLCTIINACYTQNRVCFYLSRKNLIALIKQDFNLRRRTLDTNKYTTVMKLLGTIAKDLGPNQWELTDPEILKHLTLVDIEQQRSDLQTFEQKNPKRYLAKRAYDKTKQKLISDQGPDTESREKRVDRYTDIKHQVKLISIIDLLLRETEPKEIETLVTLRAVQQELKEQGTIPWSTLTWLKALHHKL